MTLLGGASLGTTLFGLVAFLLRWQSNSTVMVAGSAACAVSLLAGVVLRSRYPRLDIYLEGLLIRFIVLGGLAFSLWFLFSGKPR